ncbi:hypothetical protein [Roseovarius confluentis]|uniref:hypothetical protein n=1 Tax=Roseovarius confluentis TaxID=1852027 RepID=UPI000CDD4173|nr:hypothetical protein [Roseovarius confluentis]
MEKFSDYLYFSQWLNFLKDVSASFAWPITVLVIALLFRKQISLLVSKLRKAKLAGNEFDFSREVDEFLDDAKEAGVEPSIVNVRELRPEDAQLIILKEFAEIEEILRSWFASNWANYEKKLNVSPNKRPVSFMARLRVLDKNNILDADTVSLLHNLRHLRNEAAHTTDFKLLAGEAFDFIATAQGLKNRVRSALNDAT